MKISRSFLRYVIVGGSSFLVEYSLYLLLHNVANLSYTISSIIVYSLLFWLVFFLNRQWSFESTGEVKVQILKYALLFLFNNIAGNVLVMRFLVETIGISSQIAPVLKMGIIVIWNYFIYKHYIYR